MCVSVNRKLTSFAHHQVRIWPWVIVHTNHLQQTRVNLISSECYSEQSCCLLHHFTKIVVEVFLQQLNFTKFYLRCFLSCALLCQHNSFIYLVWHYSKAPKLTATWESQGNLVLCKCIRHMLSISNIQIIKRLKYVLLEYGIFP